MPSWEVLCLSCGRVAKNQFGDPMEKAAIQHKKAFPCHIVFVASEIEHEEVICNVA